VAAPAGPAGRWHNPAVVLLACHRARSASRPKAPAFGKAWNTTPCAWQELMAPSPVAIEARCTREAYSAHSVLPGFGRLRGVRRQSRPAGRVGACLVPPGGAPGLLWAHHQFPIGGPAHAMHLRQSASGAPSPRGEQAGKGGGRSLGRLAPRIGRKGTLLPTHRSARSAWPANRCTAWSQLPSGLLAGPTYGVTEAQEGRGGPHRCPPGCADGCPARRTEPREPVRPRQHARRRL